MFKKWRTRRAIRHLEKAQVVLAQNELVKNAYYDDIVITRDADGQLTAVDGFCAIGALNRATNWRVPMWTLPTPSVRTAIRAMSEEVGRRIDNSLMSTYEEWLLGGNTSQRRKVIRYNDRPTTSKNEVLSLFGDAIERLNGEINPQTVEQRIDAALAQPDVELAGGSPQ